MAKLMTEGGMVWEKFSKAEESLREMLEATRRGSSQRGERFDIDQMVLRLQRCDDALIAQMMGWEECRYVGGGGVDEHWIGYSPGRKGCGGVEDIPSYTTDVKFDQVVLEFARGWIGTDNHYLWTAFHGRQKHLTVTCYEAGMWSKNALAVWSDGEKLRKEWDQALAVGSS